MANFVRLSAVITSVLTSDAAIDLDDISSFPVDDGMCTIYVDTSLREDSLENRVFNTLMTSPQFNCLAFHYAIGAGNIPQILHRAFQTMAILKTVGFVQLRMSATEAQDIFQVLGSNIPKLHQIFLQDIIYTNDIVNILTCFLRESSLRCFQLTCTHQEGTVGLSEDMFTSICDALCESENLKNMALLGSPVEDTHTERALKYFANSLVKPSPMKLVHIIPTEATGAFTMERVCHALLCTPALRNSNVCFRRSELPQGQQKLELIRECWWKNVLPQDFSLNIWPLLLAKAGRWKKETSHSPLDILFFLTREKNDLLLQNVRRRRIRRRCQFTK